MSKRDDMQVRIPEAIADWLRERARRNYRTLTAEVSLILTRQMERDQIEAEAD